MRFFYAQVMTKGKITLSGQKQVSLSGGKFQTILLLVLQSTVILQVMKVDNCG